MSRHKMIKKLDLDEELDDYDGGDDDYEYGYKDSGATGVHFSHPQFSVGGPDARRRCVWRRLLTCGAEFGKEDQGGYSPPQIIAGHAIMFLHTLLFS
jgi:hypothetical protein